jgi:hypothetical protein
MIGRQGVPYRGWVRIVTALSKIRAREGLRIEYLGVPFCVFESIVRRLLIPSVCVSFVRQTGVSSVRGRRLYMEDECRMLTCMENAAPADHHQTGRRTAGSTND